MIKRLVARVAVVLALVTGGLVATQAPALAACGGYPWGYLKVWQEPQCNPNGPGTWATLFPAVPGSDCRSLHPPTFQISLANNISSFRNDTSYWADFYTGGACTGSVLQVMPGQAASSLASPWNNNFESYRIYYWGD